jgi:Cof subfamily protein (haloacid dehalogenase superfamily)
MVLTMYKLIVSDMDGTLLNSSKEINDENIKAIKKAQSMGIEFAIATGRPYSMVKDFLKKHDLKCAVIGCNGAQIVDKDGKLVKSYYLKFDTLVKLILLAEEWNCMYNILLDKNIYTQLPKHAVWEIMRLSRANYNKDSGFVKSTINFIRFIFRNLNMNESIHEYILNEKPDVYKIDIMKADLSKIEQLNEKLKLLNDIYITSSYKNNIEVGALGVSKGNAVIKFAESLGIRREEIVSFGDNYNDMSMIEAAGIGVAMGNAEEEIKLAADFITLTNNESGVAYGINKLIFEKPISKACTQ